MENGIPIIVIAHTNADIKCPKANPNPPNIIHIILRINEEVFSPILISLPNGDKDNLANLKHCNPTGIPIIDIHQKSPTKNQAIDNKNPPNINHRIFPKNVIITPNFILKR